MRPGQVLEIRRRHGHWAFGELVDPEELRRERERVALARTAKGGDGARQEPHSGAAGGGADGSSKSEAGFQNQIVSCPYCRGQR